MQARLSKWPLAHPRTTAIFMLLLAALFLTGGAVLYGNALGLTDRTLTGRRAWAFWTAPVFVPYFVWLAWWYLRRANFVKLS